MRNFKHRFKKDFKEKLNVELNFDNSLLTPREKHYFNWRRYGKNTLIGITSFAVVLALFPLFIFGRFEDSFKSTTKKYSIQEINKMQSDYFSNLNEITYPLERSNSYGSPSKEYVEDLVSFTSSIYNQIDIDDLKSNFLFSPLALYAQLNTLYLSTNDMEIRNAINNLIGNESLRRNNYTPMLRNNFFSRYSKDYSALYNAAFIYNGGVSKDESSVSKAFIDDLTYYYTEAYSVDFNDSRAINLMNQWINARANTDMYKMPTLNIDTFLVLATIFTYYNTWSIIYNKEDTKKDNFYLNDGSTKQIDFMTHSYFTNKYVVYDDYVQVVDTYRRGGTIKYIVPKSINENIYDLNIEPDELIAYPDFIENNEKTIIRLSVPKFQVSNNIDVLKLLSNYDGINKLFDNNLNSLDRVYENSMVFGNKYISDMQQFNTIEFTEDGTEALTFEFGIGATSAEPLPNGGYDVKLNQPFIYVIYNVDQIPIYIGTYNGI